MIVMIYCGLKLSVVVQMNQWTRCGGIRYIDGWRYNMELLYQLLVAHKGSEMSTLGLMIGEETCEF